MNKKTLFAITILLIAFTSIGWQSQTKDRSILKQRFQEFKQEFKEKKALGYDISEAENLIKQAKEVHQKGDKKEARRLLKQAFGVLENAQRIVEVEKTRIFAMPETAEKKTNKRLSQVKVVSQYRIVTDYQKFNRTLDDVINIFKETRTDFIFQGWLTQWPLPERCSNLPRGEQRRYEIEGYSYEHLKNAVLKIKKELPDVIFCGGTQLEFFYPDELPDKDEKERRDKSWNMTLNLEKYGIKFSRKDMQCYWAKRWGMVSKEKPCPSEEELKQTMRYYFPDITNLDFQRVFLNRIYRQIDAGVDAIWIDMLYAQPVLIKILTKVDEDHPAVQESYKAIWEIVDKIHEYGLKKSKSIYVITWITIERGGSIIELAPKTNVDIAMLSPSSNEIRNRTTEKIGQFNEKKWDKIVKQIKEEYGIPVFARIDYGGIGRSPLKVFSQELTLKQQKEFLKIANEFFSKKGITFVYPIHGGDMGVPRKVKKLSYGKYNWYDSLAPEFQTYETIKELTRSKR